MIREPVPEDVKRFILRSIASVPHLEAILLLRAKPDQDWSERTVAERLYVSEKVAGTLLGELEEAGFLAELSGEPPRFRYQPNSEELRESIDRLAVCYSRNLMEVTNLIHSKIDRKAQQFADALSGDRTRTMVHVIYTLCAFTSISCAFLLLRGYARNRFRLLLWSGLCFVGLSFNNLLVVTDRILFPEMDLLTWRLTAALVAVILLLFGLIWDDK